MAKSTSVFVNQPSVFDLVQQELPDWLILSSRASDEQITEFLKQWRRVRMFALDIETYADIDQETAALDPWLGEIRLIQIGLYSGQVLVIDLGGYGDDRTVIHSRLEQLGLWATLKQRVEDWGCRVIGQNLSFDLIYLLKKYNITPNSVGDTMILSQLLWAGVQQYRHSLKAIAERLGMGIDKTEQKSNWYFTLTTSQILYAANDVKVIFPIYLELVRRCQEDGLMNSVNAEFMALPAYVEMMVYGMPVDLARLEAVKTAYAEAYKTVSAPFAEMFPDYTVHETAKATDDDSGDSELFAGVATSENLIAALESRLGITVSKTDKDALNHYRDNPVVASLLATRSAKVYCDYLDSISAAYRDGAVRGGYQQNAPLGRGRATSGKAAIPSINLQNPPNPGKMCPELRALDLPQIRSVFKAPEGYAMGATDYSAAHARIAAETTGDQRFIDSYNKGTDIHCVVASRLSTLVGKNWTDSEIGTIRKQKDEDGVLATRLRNTSKNVFYGWLNGAGKTKTKETIGVGGFECSEDFAEGVIALLGKSFPGIKAFHEKIKAKIKRDKVRLPGCKVTYTWVSGLSGRRVYLPVWEPTGTNKYGGAKPTDALMCCWMTVESDAKKMAMGQVRRQSQQHPEWGLRLVNDCHDELVWIAKAEHFHEAGRAVWITMQACLAYFISKIPVFESPYNSGTPITYSWDQCK